MNDFKEYPTTLGEARSDRTNCSKDWSPRDCLISILRDIDSGLISPDKLIVITHYDETDEMDEYTRACYAGDVSLVERMGLLETAKTLV
jgi:hypothetical protein